ncbi:MAG: hypothetical protein PHV34_23245 [Verrucomicrobiae bacterium]|nr:hypothetical protein [Verrucomicrobiae bacterium]
MKRPIHAILLLLVVILVALAAYLTPMIQRSLANVSQTSLMALVRELGVAMTQFSVETEHYPGSLSDPAFVSHLNEKMRAFAKRPELIYYPPSSDQTDDSETPILVLPSREGAAVFFAGGHCKWLSKAPLPPAKKTEEAP